MTHLENVSTEHLRQVLAEVERKDATQRLMAAINWKEEDGIRQKDIAQRYGYTQGWLSQWLTRLERLETEPFEDVVYDEPRSGRPSELSDQEHEQLCRSTDLSHNELVVCLGCERSRSGGVAPRSRALRVGDRGSY